MFFGVWPKSLFRFFHRTLQKNANKLFSQPHSFKLGTVTGACNKPTSESQCELTKNAPNPGCLSLYQILKYSDRKLVNQFRRKLKNQYCIWSCRHVGTVSGQHHRNAHPPFRSLVWWCSVTKVCPTLPPLGRQRTAHPSLSSTSSQSLLKLSSTESVVLPDHLILCRPSPVAFCLSQAFLMSRLSASCGQSVGASPSASILPMNIHSWVPLALMGLISFSSIIIQKQQFLGAQPSLWYIWTWLREKLQLWLDGPLLAKRCLCFLICCLGLS